MSPSTSQSSSAKSSRTNKSASTSAKIVKKAKVAQKDGSWKEARDYLDDTEKRLKELGSRVEDLTSKLESKAKATTNDLEEYYKSLHTWLSSQIDKVRTLEASTETWYDTARVKTHLAKMEVTEAAGEFIHRLDQLKARLDQLTTKTTPETTGELLKTFSQAFSRWREKIVH